MLQLLSGVPASGLMGIVFYMLIKNMIDTIKTDQTRLEQHRQKEEEFFLTINVTLQKLIDRIEMLK